MTMKFQGKRFQMLGLGLVITLTIGLVLWQIPPGVYVPLMSQEVKVTIPTKYLLLITNGRSGSSFTSALLSKHPDVFYWFEPLYPLQEAEATKHNPDVFWLNTHENISIEILENHFHCKPRREASLVNVQMKNSEHTDGHFECFVKKKLGIGYIHCYEKLISDCKSRNLTFIKTIRFPVRYAQHFMDEHPDLKVIYLIRDPRAVMYSQAKVFKSFNFSSPTQLENQTRTFCGSLTEDLHYLRDLNNRYPGRVMAIRYEDGALHPMAYARAIYNFVGLDFTDDMKKHVKEMTSGTKIKSDNPDFYYSVYRENSTQAMNHWRQNVSFEGTTILDRHCGHLYPNTGYKLIESKEKLKSGESIVKTPPKHSLFYRDDLSR